MNISTLIVDDEPLARAMIARLLRPRPEFEIIGQCGTGKDAVVMINTHQPDLVFLDIQLKDMTGFEVLEGLNVKFPLVIFATAFDTYSLKAFDYFAFDYLLKPFSEERFYKSINKVIETIVLAETDSIQRKLHSLLAYIQPNNAQQKTTQKTIPIPLKNKTIFINIDDIQYITASNNYIEIFTKESRYVVRNTISNIMEELADPNFIRIHRSTIINLDCVKELINSSYGELDVRMRDMKQFRVSRSYKKELLATLGLRK